MPTINDVITFTRASIGTYWDAAGVLRTAPINAWRNDHDPLTGEARGLLIEPVATNLLRNTELNAGWSAGGSTPPLFEQVSHFGVDCVKATFRPADDIGYAGTRLTRGNEADVAMVTAGVTYSHSIFIMFGRPLLAGESVALYWAGVSESAVTIVTADFITAAGRWLRVELPPHLSVASGSLFPSIYKSGVLTADLDVFLARPQTEAGSAATSYIPSTSAATTRAQDVAYVTPSAFSYDTAGGTVVVRYRTGGRREAQAVWALDAGTAADRVPLFDDTASGPTLNPTALIFTKAGVATTLNLTSAGGAARNAKHSVAVTFMNGRQRASLDGAPAVGTTGDLPSVPPSRLWVGSQLTGTVSPLSGHIERLTYVPRQFTDAELQEASTL